MQLSVPDQTNFLRFLRTIADPGLVIELTEVDIAKTAFLKRLIEGEEAWELRAQVYGGLASSCVSVEACRRITTWGIDDAHTWLDDSFPFSVRALKEPLLLDPDLNRKPAVRGSSLDIGQ